MAELLYQGHGSYRLAANDGTVIYVDPYAGKGYDLPADIILVTHEHGDHNQISLAAKKPGCRIITEQDALKDGEYQSFSLSGITIDSVPAYNRNHSKKECVGYVITMDGIKLYAAGDTSTTDAMGTSLKEMRLDYALLPTDGVYNMDPAEASDCAKAIGAKHTIPIHTKPGSLFDRKQAEKFQAEGRLIVEPGEEITLV